MLFFNGNNQIAKMQLLVGVSPAYFEINASFNPANTGNTGDQSILRIQGGIQPAANVNNSTNQTQIIIDPTIDQFNGLTAGGTGSGTLRGIYYNPTVTDIAGSANKHVAIQTVKGDVLFGTGRYATGEGGYVGIGQGFNPTTGATADMPQRPLHVRDIMRLQSRNTFPAGASAGDIMMYTDGSSNVDLYYYGATAGVGGWRKVSFI